MGITITSSGEYVERNQAEFYNSQFVIKVYHDLLGRDPDPGGFVYWISELHSGAMAREDVAKGFLDSPEFLPRFVTSLFENYGGGVQPYAGLVAADAAWMTTTMRAGGPSFSLERQRVLFDQDFSHYPDPAHDDGWNFLFLLFQQFYGIAYDPFNPTPGPETVFAGELNSGVSANDISNQALVDSSVGQWLGTLYLIQYLGGMAPDPNEIVKYLGPTIPDLIAFPNNSSEVPFYFAKNIFVYGPSKPDPTQNRLTTYFEDDFLAAVLGTREYCPRG
jgi:hypothetical protein